MKNIVLSLLLLVPVAPLAADGDLDPGFGDAGVAVVETVLDDVPAAVASDVDGKLVVAGSVLAGTGSSTVVYRFTADGALDPSFDGDGVRIVSFTFGGVSRSFPSDVAVLADGRIVVAGYAEDATSTTRAGMLIRLLPDGALDTTFDGDGIFLLGQAGDNHRFGNVAIRPNGAVVVAGRFDDALHDSELAVYELTPSGALTSLAIEDVYPADDDFPVELMLEPDGRMVIAALAFNASELVVTRWNTNFLLDETFDGDGIGRYDWGESVRDADLDRLEDGRYVIGVSTDLWTGFEWLQPNGASDPTTCTASPFCIFTGFPDFTEIAAQPDGRVLAIGSSDGGESDVRVVRLLANGALDTAFGTAGARDFDCEPGSSTADDGGTALALSGGRAAALGSRSGLPADDGVCLARLSSALISRSGFESGIAWGWSSSSP
jgi:uncharacterized delta-60 repeat protein